MKVFALSRDHKACRIILQIFMYLNGFCIRFDSPDEVGKETCRRLVCNEDIKTHVSDVHMCVPAMLSYGDYQKHSRSVRLIPGTVPDGDEMAAQERFIRPVALFPTAQHISPFPISSKHSTAYRLSGDKPPQQSA